MNNFQKILTNQGKSWTSRKKIVWIAGVVILILAISVGAWWIWNTQTSKEIDCSKITSMSNIEKCVGERIEAIGILKGDKPSKGGLHYLKFKDDSELWFLEVYPTQENYEDKEVKVIGEFYQCGGLDQCVGTGLTNIQSINLISEPAGEVTIATDKTDYEQGEEVKIEILSQKQIYFLPLLNFALTLEQKNNGAWIELAFIDWDCSNSTGIPKPPSCEYSVPKDSWDQSILECINGEAVYRQTSPGTYRFLFQYWEDDCWGSIEKKIYSNEFRVREKTDVSKPSSDLKDFPRCPDGKLLSIWLDVYTDDTVKEQEISVVSGVTTPLPAGEGEYELRIVDLKSDIVFSENFPLYFTYSGPMVEGVDYSDIEYNTQMVSTRIACQLQMHTIQLWRGKKLLFEKEIPSYLTPPILQGTVTDWQGKPLAGYSVTITDKSCRERGRCGASELANTYTNEKGEYLIGYFNDDTTKLKEGVYILQVYSMNPNLKSEVLEVSVGKDEVKTVDIILKQSGSISGKITDENGNPITEAWVYEVGFETPRYHVCELSGCELGTYILSGLEPGEYTIGAEVKVGDDYIQLPSKKVKVELGKTSTLDFVFEE